MAVKYRYSILRHSKNGIVAANSLHEEIVDSDVKKALDGVSTFGDHLDVSFKEALDYVPVSGIPSSLEVLSGLVAEHEGVPLPDEVEKVDIAKIELAGQDVANPDGILFSIPKASGAGYVMNDRDVLICTSHSGIGAYEDLKVNPYTLQREDWKEVTLIGVYKSSDTANDPFGRKVPLVPVADQEDADKWAICSAYDYQAKVNGTTPVAYEIRGGNLYVDVAMSGLGTSVDEMQQHQIYALAAPNIPDFMGGQMKFFDGYLMGYQQDWMPAESTDAMRLDPALSSEASKIRVYIYYTPGAKLHHILRLITYRKPGT